MALSFSFDASKGETPESVASRRKAADALAARIFGRTPQNVGEGLSALGQAFIARQMTDEANAAQLAGQSSGAAAFSPIAAAIMGTGAPAASAPVATAPMGGLPAMPSRNVASDRIYENDEPSPLDPPSGADRDAAIRTVVAEAGNQGPVGMNAVASVIKNRAANGGYGGNTAGAVVRAPNQFEPWNTEGGRAKMAAIDPNSQQYKDASAALDSAYFGNDPTSGAVNFIQPKLQKDLGRAMPAWAMRPGIMIGDHKFIGGATAAPTQVASAGDDAELPANAENVQGVLPSAETVRGVPQRPMTSPGPTMQQLLQAQNNPWLTEGQRATINTMVKQKLEEEAQVRDPLRQNQILESRGRIEMIPIEREGKLLANDKARRDLQPMAAPYKDDDGNLVQDDASGKRTILSAAEKAPTSVQEYKYYKDNLPPGEKPMDYGTWSTSKARAAATQITNNVGGDGETAFEKEAAKLQAGRYNDLIVDGQKSRQLISDINTLLDLGKGIQTGKGAQFRAFIGPYAEAIGVPIKGLGDIQAYEAVVNRMAPSLRVAGSGSQSDFELKNFLKSVPSLGNTPEGNQIASVVMNGLQENKVRAADIASKVINKEITRTEGEKMLRELPDPMQPYRDYRKNQSKVNGLLDKYGAK